MGNFDRRSARPAPSASGGRLTLYTLLISVDGVTRRAERTAAALHAREVVRKYVR